MTQNTTGGLKMELALLDFSNKASVRLDTTIEKTMEKCKEFYKKMCTTHNKCQASAATQVQDFPDKRSTFEESPGQVAGRQTKYSKDQKH